MADTTPEESSALRAALQRAAPRATAPAGLADAIRRATVAAPPAPVVRYPAWRLWSNVAFAAAAALAVGFVWGGWSQRRYALDREAVSAHVRSMQAEHLLDVVSTDQHTVKPWFAGRLDFSPPVADLAPAGFPLVGGRLDRLGARTVAALVFHDHKHTINLFIWPGKPLGPSHSSEDGFQTESWSAGDFAFLAVSDVPAPELSRFAGLYRQRAGEP